MNFTLKRNPSQYDVTIASIGVGKVTSDDVIQLVDMAGGIAGNSTAAASTITTATCGEDYGTPNRLLAKNVFGKVEITDEFVIDKVSGIKTPLWYRHSLRRQYYNASLSQRALRKTIRSGQLENDRIVKNLVPSDSNYVIISDSVLVQREGGDYHDAYVNYAEGTVYIYSIASHTVSEGDVYIVTYDLLPVSVSIEKDLDTYVRTEVERTHSDCNTYFILRFLCSKAEPMEVKYQAPDANGEIVERTETTVASPLFAEASYETVQGRYESGTDYPNDYYRIFCVTQSGSSRYVLTSRDQTRRTFIVRPKYAADTVVEIIKPDQKYYNKDWFLGVRTGSFVGSEGRTFTVENRSVVDELEEVTENAVIVDRNTLSLSRPDILSYITADGEIGGVTVTRGNGTEATVDGIDRKNGVVYLDDDVSSKDTVTVSYRARKDYASVETVCFNPIESHEEHNPFESGVPYQAFVILLGDGTHTPAGELPVYIKQLELYDGSDFMSYQSGDIESLLNSDDAEERYEYRSGIPNLPDVYLASGLVRLEVLGLVYEANPLDSDGYEIMDARIYGGGMNTRQRSFHDHAHYDGESIDLDSYLRAHIPQDTFDDLLTKALQWDRDVRKISDSATRQDLAKQKVRTTITEKVRKFSSLGTVREVIIE